MDQALPFSIPGVSEKHYAFACPAVTFLTVITIHNATVDCVPEALCLCVSCNSLSKRQSHFTMLRSIVSQKRCAYVCPAIPFLNGGHNSQCCGRLCLKALCLCVSCNSLSKRRPHFTMLGLMCPKALCLCVLQFPF